MIRSFEFFISWYLAIVSIISKIGSIVLRWTNKLVKVNVLTHNPLIWLQLSNVLGEFVIIECFMNNDF